MSMPKVEYEVLAEYNPSKHLGKFTKSQTKCIQLLKKGIVFTPVKLINDNLEYLPTFTAKNKHRVNQNDF